MKIKANNANDPIWKEVNSRLQLPKELQCLQELATNLWWVWNYEGAKLFGKLDADLWKSTEGNPVILLQNLSYNRVEEILSDEELMGEINKVYKDFKTYMSEKVDVSKPTVAYFSMEYGLTNVLKIYSGGLGVLAGDYLKEASDSRIDMCAVGFLYRYGYFTQSLSMDGQQIANYEAQDFSTLPLTQVTQSNGEPMLLEVPYPGRVVYAHIWKVMVGRVPLYLMDTDIPQNSEWDRSITHQLYGGDWENRMKQEYMLGIGGIMMLNKLGIKKQIYHCNEGHAALINVQRLVDFIQMVKDVSLVQDTIKIHLRTQNDDDEKIAEVIDNFNELADELLPMGIEFTYDFKADHDRLIHTDTGWTITLGRGLDIYEKFSRFSLSRSNQQNRRCKAFNVSINKADFKF